MDIKIHFLLTEHMDMMERIQHIYLSLYRAKFIMLDTLIRNHLKLIFTIATDINNHR